MLRNFILLIALVALVGCSSAVRYPQFLHPGPAGFQQNNAMQFDPYPPNDVAPAIVGGRPLDFQKPAGEVERARQYQTIAPWRQAPLY